MNKKTVGIIIFIIFVLVAVSGSKIPNSTEYTETEIDYTDMCEYLGDYYNICPEFIEAVIEYEPEDDSRIGLMHIDYNENKDRMTRLHVTNLEDPELNILVGCDYLSELFDEYEDPYLVLSKFLGIAEDDTATLDSILARANELEDEHGKLAY